MCTSASEKIVCVFGLCDGHIQALMMKIDPNEATTRPLLNAEVNADLTVIPPSWVISIRRPRSTHYCLRKQQQYKADQASSSWILFTRISDICPIDVYMRFCTTKLSADSRKSSLSIHYKCSSQCVPSVLKNIRYQAYHLFTTLTEKGN